MINFIFLDIDGVLNTRKSWGKRVNMFLPTIDSNLRMPHFDEECVENLNKITKETGACLVITSTWRMGEYEEFLMLIDHLKHEGVDAPVIGRTPIAENKTEKARSIEIQSWLDNWKNKYQKECKFVIIDDQAEMGQFSGSLIKTDYNTGITKAHIKEAIEKLENAQEY